MRCSVVHYSEVKCSAVQWIAVRYSAERYSEVRCSTVQCSAVQCSAVQCCVVQCCAVRCSAVQYSMVQFSAVMCSTLQYSAELYSAVRCSTVRCGAVQCSAVWCSTVRYSVVQYGAARCSGVQYGTVQYGSVPTSHNCVAQWCESSFPQISRYSQNNIFDLLPQCAIQWIVVALLSPQPINTCLAKQSCSECQLYWSEYVLVLHIPYHDAPAAGWVKHPKPLDSNVMAACKGWAGWDGGRRCSGATGPACTLQLNLYKFNKLFGISSVYEAYFG